jgi:hypothetical protein
VVVENAIGRRLQVIKANNRQFVNRFGVIWVGFLAIRQEVITRYFYDIAAYVAVKLVFSIL